MYAPPGVKTNHNEFPIPDGMRAWVLGGPGELGITEKPVPVPKRAEVLVRIDAVAICATDLEIIYHGPPASIQGGLPFNKGFTPGHEYMGTVVALGPGVDEYGIGQRVAVEIHAGCGQCKRCREGMYTSCHNYGLNYGDVDKGHRANGFTTDGGFCEYQVNNINTLVALQDEMTDEEGTLVVTAGTAMYALTELGGLVAGESVCVTGPGPIGLMAVAVAKALGAQPVILTGTRDNRLDIGKQLGADAVVNIRKEKDVVAAVKKLNGGKGVDYVVECSAATSAVNDAVRMVNRGGKVCLAAFAHEEVPVDVAHIVRNNIYVYGIRGEGKSATHRAEAYMRQKRFDATKIHTHTFSLDDLPTAIRYAKDRVEDAIKVVVKAKMDAAQQAGGGVTVALSPLLRGEGGEDRSTSRCGRASVPRIAIARSPQPSRPMNGEREHTDTRYDAYLRRILHARFACRRLRGNGGQSRPLSHRRRLHRHAALGARGQGGRCAYSGADRRQQDSGVVRAVGQ